MLQFPARLWFLWSVFVLEGMFTLVTLPLWEGFDEPYHFAVVRALAIEHRWPQPNETLPPAILDSFRRLPLPEALLAPGHRDHSSFWNPTRPPPHPPPQTWRMYESQQVPLYYLVLSLVLVPASQLPIEHQVLLLRLVTLLLASCLIPLAYVVAGRRHGLWAAAFVVFLPQYVMTSARITNDSLAAVCFALLAALIARDPVWFVSPRRALLVGLVAGMALLAKSYLLVILPALWMSGGWRGVRGSLTATAGAALIAGPWYVNTWLTTGSLSGEQIEATTRLSPLSLFSLGLKVDWWAAISFVFSSHVWLGNWSFVGLRGWMYHLLAILFLLVAAAAIRHLATASLGRFLLTSQLLLAAALAYHVILTFASTGRSATFGHYLDGCLLAEAVLLAPVLPSLCGRLLLLSLTVLATFGRWIYLMPFYAGFIVRTDSGSLPAFKLPLYNADVLWRMAVQSAAMLRLPALLILGCTLLGALITLVKLGFLVNESTSRFLKMQDDKQRVSE